MKPSRLFPELAILLKYGKAYLDTKEKMDQLSDQMFSNISYPEKEEDFQAIKQHKSRTLQPLVLQALGIYKQNRGKIDDDAINFCALQSLLVKAMSMLDDFHDLYFVPFWTDLGKCTVENVKRDIRNEGDMQEFARLQKPKMVDGKTIHATHYLRGSAQIQSYYSSKMFNTNLNAFTTYILGRDAAIEAQARDIAISVLLKRDDVKGALEIFGDYRNPYDVSRFLDKLGIAGGEAAVIANQISWAGPEGKQGLVNEKIREFFRNITNFGQFGIDDIRSLEEDYKSRSPNVLIFSYLQHYGEFDKASVRKFLWDNPRVISEVLEPLVKDTIESLKELKKIDFAYEECVLATLWFFDKVKNSVEYLERKYYVATDRQWWEEFQELKKSL